MRGYRAVTAVIAATVIVAAGTHLGGQGSGGPQVGGAVVQTANLWVNTTAGASPSRCSSACAYDSTKAYGSLNAAYAAASQGDVIIVKNGSYAAQTIAKRSLGSSVVTIQGETGTTPTLASLTINTPYLTVDGFTITGGAAMTGALSIQQTAGTIPFDVHDVTVKNFSAQFGFIKADNVTLQHGNIGPYHACVGLDAGGTEDGLVISGLNDGGGTLVGSDGVTIDDVDIHDIDRWTNGVQAQGVCGGGSPPHTDGIQSFSGTNFTIKNSHEWNTATSFLIMYRFNTGSVVDHIHIFNNEFGDILESGHGLSIGDGTTCNGTNDIVIENNTFYGNVTADMQCGGVLTPGEIFRSNYVASESSCSASNRQFNYSYNVFVSPPADCSSTSHEKTCTATFVDSAHTNGNGDMASDDSCVKDAGDPTNYPSSDINGVARKIGAASDAGANER